MSLQTDLSAALSAAQQGRHKAALKAARAGMKRHKTHPAFPNIAAIALCALDKPREAVPLFQSALRLKPDFHEARRNLGQALLSLGKPDLALRVLGEHLKLQPNDSGARLALAVAQGDLNQPDTALETLAALPKLPPEALILRARLLAQLGRFKDAIETQNRAVALMPARADLLLSLSAWQAEMGHGAQALQTLETALERAPQDVDIALAWVAQALSLGQTEAARARLEGLLAAHPHHPAALEQFAMIATAQDAATLHPVLEAALRTRGISEDDQAGLIFAQARLHRLQGAAEQASACLVKGNALMARLSPYDAPAQEALNAAILSQPAPAPLDPKTPFPIYVLGLPRTGTTLVEAILGTHTQVAPLGERKSIDMLHAALGETGQIDPEALAQFATRDRAALPELPVGTRAFVDKMPENHRWIGFLRAAHPNARFIHLRRHPLDTALSMWEARFRPGTLGYTNDWAAMAHRFNLYARMMAHWQALYPDDILTLNYEDLVNDLPHWGALMARHCGLDWQEAMAEPDRHAGQIRTQSLYQLRQPVHARSVGKWQSRLDELETFRAALDPALWPEIA